MQPIPIDDPADSRLAAYRDIRERDLVGRQGRFIAEGRVVLDALFSSPRFEAESVLVLRNRLAGLAGTLQKAPADLPIYVASSAVMDEIAGFPVHRGILGIGRRRATDEASELLAALPRRALVVVLVGIANHDNIGSIFRNARGFGADAVFLDRTCCDPLYRKAIRVSTGSILHLPYASFEDAPGFAATLADKGFETFALSPRGAADISAVQASARIALFLGTEGAGLPEAVLAEMKTLRIATVDGFDSLNVAAASAVALHHFARQTGKTSLNLSPPPEEPSPARPG